MSKRVVDVTTIEGRRLVLLKKIGLGRTCVQFAQYSGLTASYVSQIMSGSKLLSTHSAKLMEARLGLIPGVLQKPEDANMLEDVSVNSLYLDPERNVLPEDDRDAEIQRDHANELRVIALKAIMGRLSLVEFCTYYGLNRPLVKSVLAGTKPFPLTLAKKLESKLKLNPGSLVYPADASIGDHDCIAELQVIHAPNLKTNRITSAGKKLLDILTASLTNGDLTEGQILALTVMAENFSKQTSAQNSRWNEIHEQN